MPGQLFIVAAPSGAGKTSLVQQLLLNVSLLKRSISYTTRAPRPGEQDGIHYHFVSDEKFKDMLAQAQFVEHALVFGNYYGTAAPWLKQQLEQGWDVVLEIDWQGARQVKKYFPHTIGIFILPPSIRALAERLRSRKQDSEQTIRERMQQAVAEMSHYTEFDYIVINDTFQQALQELEVIVKASRLMLRQISSTHAALLKSLLSGP